MPYARCCMRDARTSTSYRRCQPTPATGQPEWDRSQTGKRHVLCLCIFVKILPPRRTRKFCARHVNDQTSQSVLFLFDFFLLLLAPFALTRTLICAETNFAVTFFCDVSASGGFSFANFIFFSSFSFCVPERHSFLVLLNEKNGKAENRSTKRKADKKMCAAASETQVESEIVHAKSQIGCFCAALMLQFGNFRWRQRAKGEMEKNR